MGVAGARDSGTPWALVVRLGATLDVPGGYPECRRSIGVRFAGQVGSSLRPMCRRAKRFLFASRLAWCGPTVRVGRRCGERSQLQANHAAATLLMC